MELTVWFKGFWNNTIEQDLRTGKADIVAIQNYIAHFVIGSADGRAALDYEKSAVKTGGSIDKFFSLINDNAYLQDSAQVTETLRTSPALLQKDESVEAAYKSGRDLFLITTKRIIVVDKKGITGKSVEYKSFPLMYNKGFRIETEGHLLNGAKVEVHAETGGIEQELAKGSNDLWDMHKILSHKMLNEHHPGIGEPEISFSP